MIAKIVARAFLVSTRATFVRAVMHYFAVYVRCGAKTVVMDIVPIVRWNVNAALGIAPPVQRSANNAVRHCATTAASCVKSVLVICARNALKRVSTAPRAVAKNVW